MPRYRVLVTDYAWEDLEIERAILAEIDAEIVQPDQGDLQSAARDVDAILCNWAPTTEDVIAAAPACQIVSRMGIGLDNIAVDYCTSRGIPVTNVPDYCLIEVAEHTLALLLSLARNVAHYHWRTKSGEYQLQSGLPLKRLQGQTLGLVGFGQIGHQVVTRAAGLGFRILVTSRQPKPDTDQWQWCELPELLRESDFVSLHCPLNAETRHLINDETLALMKPSACLINTARGGVVDAEALARALANGTLAGAALDVQEPEPPDLSQPPYNDPRVIVTPHAAFVSQESLQDLRRRAATQVKDRLSGKRPESVVNPEVFA